MPKKSAKKTATRTLGATRSSSSADSVNLSRLRADQAEFHQKHPYANNLIGLFIFAFCMLVVLYLFSGATIY